MSSEKLSLWFKSTLHCENEDDQKQACEAILSVLNKVDVIYADNEEERDKHPAALERRKRVDAFLEIERAEAAAAEEKQ